MANEVITLEFPIKRYWIRWFQFTEDNRPLKDPPEPENIRAWWETGFASVMFRRCTTLSAIVDAVGPETAKAAIREAWDATYDRSDCGFDYIGGERDLAGSDPSDDLLFDSVTEKPIDWLPGDRFPIDAEWEKKRLGIS